MDANDFRRIARSLEGTEERSHLDKPDFLVGGRILTTPGGVDSSNRVVDRRNVRQVAPRNNGSREQKPSEQNKGGTCGLTIGGRGSRNGNARAGLCVVHS